MRVPLANNYTYNQNRSNHNPSFGAPKKIPGKINEAFRELRKEVASLPESGKPNGTSINLLSGSDDAVALIAVSRKRKNWLLSFFIENQGQKTDVNVANGDKNAIDSVLKDIKAKKNLEELLKSNGLHLGSV